jgi:hypothetical protein
VHRRLSHSQTTFILLLRRLHERRATEAASDNFQVDLPNAALNVNLEVDVGVPIGIVYVGIAFPLEALCVDLAESTLGSNANLGHGRRVLLREREGRLDRHSPL